MNDPFDELRTLTFEDWDEAYEAMGFDDDSPVGRIILRILAHLATTAGQWLSVYAYSGDIDISSVHAAEQIRRAARTCLELKSGTSDEVFNYAHAIQAALEMEKSVKYLLIRHPNGEETRYNGEIGAMHS